MIPFVPMPAFEYGRTDAVSPLIRRVIANNPGPFTFTGTGTYIVGRAGVGAGVAVIDPGPLDEAHLAALLRAVEGQTVSQCVADVVERLSKSTAVEAERSGSIGAVVGATHPAQLAQLREQMPHGPLLIPGYGSQGGTSADVASAFHADGTGALINSSRGIIFAASRKEYKDRYEPKEWEKAVEQATLDMIVDLAEHTPAGNLRKSS